MMEGGIRGTACWTAGVSVRRTAGRTLAFTLAIRLTCRLPGLLLLMPTACAPRFSQPPRRTRFFS